MIDPASNTISIYISRARNHILYGRGSLSPHEAICMTHAITCPTRL
jgi:hypothetical protein